MPSLFDFIRNDPPAVPVSLEALRQQVQAEAHRLYHTRTQSLLATPDFARTVAMASLARATELGTEPDDYEPFIEVMTDLVAADPLFTFTPRDVHALAYADLLKERQRLSELASFLRDPEPLLDRYFFIIGTALGAVLRGLPAHAEGISVPSTIIDVKQNLPETIDDIVGIFLHASDLVKQGCLTHISAALSRNMLTVAGLTPKTNDEEFWRRYRMAKDAKAPPRSLIEPYLDGLYLDRALQLPWNVTIPHETRFEHTHILAGSGHGKTQTLQYLLAHDFHADHAVVVIDSQGDLIHKLAHVEHVQDRLILIDPTDIEHPLALNLFDVNIERINRYGPVERERLTNGAIELLEYLLGAVLGAELTAKQGTLFRFAIRLMLNIPNSTIHTFREIMEPGGLDTHREHVKTLSRTARLFFETQFEERDYKQTRQQVVRRIWSILENPTFERMFSAPKSRLDLKVELDAGKIILVNTAKSFLKQEGAAILGRYFIATLALVVQERAEQRARKDTLLYIDEVQDYARGGEQNLAVMFEQFRKYRCGVTVAHQALSQIGPLEPILASNTAIKLAGGTSAADARAMAREIRCEPEDVLKQPKGSFSAYIKGQGTFSLSFPFGVLEALPRVDSIEPLRERMRERYARLPEPETPQPATKSDTSTPENTETRDHPSAPQPPKKDDAGPVTDW